MIRFQTKARQRQLHYKRHYKTSYWHWHWHWQLGGVESGDQIYLFLTLVKCKLGEGWAVWILRFRRRTMRMICTDGLSNVHSVHMHMTPIPHWRPRHQANANAKVCHWSAAKVYWTVLKQRRLKKCHQILRWEKCRGPTQTVHSLPRYVNPALVIFFIYKWQRATSATNMSYSTNIKITQ